MTHLMELDKVQTVLDDFHHLLCSSFKRRVRIVYRFGYALERDSVKTRHKSVLKKFV